MILLPITGNQRQSYDREPKMHPELHLKLTIGVKPKTNSLLVYNLERNAFKRVELVFWTLWFKRIIQ